MLLTAQRYPGVVERKWGLTLKLALCVNGIGELEMEHIDLSERNLRVLLSKLERFKAGDQTGCTIIKYANPTDPFCCSMDSIRVTAVPDESYYAVRNPGVMHPKDEPCEVTPS